MSKLGFKELAISGNEKLEDRKAREAKYFKWRMAKQKEEILGAENKWYATEALGHEPTPQELADHYLNHQAAVDFAERYPQIMPENWNPDDCKEDKK